jgi:hypothetical protein
MARKTDRILAEPRRPVPGIDPAIARLSEMLLAVLSELTVVRERLDTVERLIARHDLFKQDDIETFEATPEEDATRTAIRKRQIQKVMRPLLDDVQRDLQQSSRKES